MDTRLSAENGSLPSCPADNPPSHLTFIFQAIDGFIPSIIAIGCARAWLSLQTGIVAVYETSLAPDVLGGWLQGVCLVAASLALPLVKLGPWFTVHRRALCAACGVAGSVLYAVGLYLAPGNPMLLSVAAAALVILFCWMLRLWCEDNCSSDLRAVLVRLCLSFVVQYVFYSSLFLIPSAAQRVAAITTPLVIMRCLSVRPHALDDPRIVDNHTARSPLSPINVVTLGVVIAACCASHGLLFSFSETVSGVWLLGSLVIAGIALAAVITLRECSLFKGFVCIALVTQCLSVVLTLLFPEDNDWISLSKSMSYAVSMVLTFSIAAYLGASKTNPHAGSYAARWVALYFVAFYAARLLEQTVRPDTFASLVAVLVFLVVSAVLMLGNDWSGLTPDRTPAANAEEDEAAEKTNRVRRYRDITHEAGLTAREADVLGLLLENVPVKEIAAQSGVSVNTVRSQVQAAYRKLDVHSREELVELFEREASDR